MKSIGGTNPDLDVIGCGEDNCTLNHGGESKVQQELVGHTPVHPTGGHHLARKYQLCHSTKLGLTHRNSSDPQMREYGFEQCFQ